MGYRLLLITDEDWGRGCMIGVWVIDLDWAKGFKYIIDMSMYL